MTIIDLNGRVAAVTGASRGIGRAAAETLLKAGCSVVLNARASDEASASFAELETAFPDRVTAVYGSVADGVTATAIAQAAMSRYKRLDILVNNAGILREKVIGMISDAEISELFDVNIIGLIKVTQLAARIMTRRKSGSIVNISSIVGMKGGSGQIVYSATKSAVIGATFSAAKELAPLNIRVNAIAPGLIDTSMTQAFADIRRKSLESQVAMGRVGSPQEVANAILFFASDLSAYVTGQVIGVDGGLVI
ncbi:MAG: SDR family NAD(P)-dependent oxidoreductase [Roseiarcus sp.]|uniref:SDR family NAD(P)-dependent oxidoreductase n=1 Tax=Roseiarcus sp. TaxID=1969460 RepID=UPI003C627990